jgi:hypothetical protein
MDRSEKWHQHSVSFQSAMLPVFMVRHFNYINCHLELPPYCLTSATLTSETVVKLIEPGRDFVAFRI